MYVGVFLNLNCSTVFEYFVVVLIISLLFFKMVELLFELAVLAGLSSLRKGGL